MIAMDGGPESWYAVKWGIENVVRFGDNVLILYVGSKEEETGDYSAKALMWEKGGTPFIPLMEFGTLKVSCTQHPIGQHFDVRKNHAYFNVVFLPNMISSYWACGRLWNGVMPAWMDIGRLHV